MARDYNAFSFPSNPKQIYGVEETDSIDGKSSKDVVITNILYEAEARRLPTINVGTSKESNRVHACTRHDKAVQKQVFAFINDDVILDVCAADEEGCVRTHADC